MKKAAIIACSLLFVAVAGVAETKSPPPLSAQAMAAILGQPAVQGSCPTPQSEVLFAARRPAVPKSCSATATCASGTVSCSVPGAGGTCTFANRDCSINERGHVTCNGVTTNCPTSCCTPPVWCCQCDNTGDCFSCCRCGGGGPGQCALQCG